MTQINYSDPSEGVEYSGYHSFEVIEDGTVLAEFQFAPEMLPDFEDPEDLIELGEVFQRVGAMAAEMDQ